MKPANHHPQLARPPSDPLPISLASATDRSGTSTHAICTFATPPLPKIYLRHLCAEIPARKFKLPSHLYPRARRRQQTLQTFFSLPNSHVPIPIPLVPANNNKARYQPLARSSSHTEKSPCGPDPTHAHSSSVIRPLGFIHPRTTRDPEGPARALEKSFSLFLSVGEQWCDGGGGESLF